ncbi:MAG: hypothetical protein ACKVS8_04025 [Phycisphaerales bacterium]
MMGTSGESAAPAAGADARSAQASGHLAPHDPRFASAREERLGELCGDRLCVKCQFNLTGQLIVREPHYGMVIVRCPECSTVASLQEYPLLGKWVGRWTGLLAAVWFIALCAMMAGSVGMMTAMTITVADDLAAPLAVRIGTMQKAESAAQIAANPLLAGSANSWGAPEWLANQAIGDNMLVDGTWWVKQDEARVIADVGGVWACIDVRRTLAWWPFSFLVLGVGTAWSVALLHQPRRRVWLFALVIAGIALTIAVIVALQSSTFGWRGLIGAGEAARRALGWPVNIVGVLAFTPVLMGSLVVGRSIVRGLIRLMLPPRLRGPLATLWIADGLAVPRGKGQIAKGK